MYVNEVGDVSTAELRLPLSSIVTSLLGELHCSRPHSVQPPTAALTRLSKDTYIKIVGIIPRKDISLSYQRNKFSLIAHNTRLTKILTNTTNYLHRYDISINSIIETSSAVSVV